MRIPPSEVGKKEGVSKVEDRTAAPRTASQCKAPASEPAVVVSSRASETVAKSEQSEAERSARIERISKEIKNGTYRVDKDKLAERLVDEELARARPV